VNGRASKPPLAASGAAAVLLAAVISAASCPGAPIVLESATMGPPAQAVGAPLSPSHFMAWRFSITSPLAVTEVGGHLGQISGELFAAIISLPAVDAMPQAAPLSPAITVSSAVFAPPQGTADVRVPLSSPLAAGAYALVFGSGEFNASGSGLMPSGQQTNIAPATQSSYIAWRQSLPGQFSWMATSQNNLRFVVNGLEFAGPADFNLDGRINGADLLQWRQGYGAPGQIQQGDADGDGDVDGADFLVWQRATRPASAAGMVPEPSAALLVVAAALGAALVGTRSGRRLINRFV
jgi:hypothetical protein